MAKQEIVEWDDKAYLRFLPPELQERYKTSVDDPQLLDLRRQISLMDVRITSLLETLDRTALTKELLADDIQLEFPKMKRSEALDFANYMLGYMPQSIINYRTFTALDRLVEKWIEYELDGRDKDVERTRKKLFYYIQNAKQEGDAWEDILKTMEERRKLTSEEGKRLAENQQTMPLERVVLLIGLTIEALKESVHKYVPDREIQQYILKDADSTYRRQLGLGANQSSDERDMD